MQERFIYLLDRYRSREATPTELQEFYIMLSSGAYDKLFIKSIDAIYENDDDQVKDEEYYPLGARERMLQQIFDRKEEEFVTVAKHKQVKLWPRIVLAAASIALVVMGFWFFSSNFNHQHELISYTHNIVPGSSGATLTLSNGKKISLSGIADGELIKEGGISIKKSANGQLLYQINQDEVNLTPQAASLTHTLSTANGQTFQVLLPDGSLVYLNAASSLTYTSSLLEKGKRVVKLKGEAYFEISPDKAHPFIVKTASQEVEVLGTHFNVSSYENEEEETTLLEGSVSMTAAGRHQILKPGEQGKLKKNTLAVDVVDTDMVVAWKNNEFVFKSESIEGVMKMVERWYNVDVIFVGDKTNEKFSGSVSRFDNVTNLLSIIASTEAVHFKIEGRKIYVSK